MSTIRDREPLAPDRPPAEDAPPARYHRWSAPRVAVLLLAIVFFTLPGLAYLAGARAQQIENRPLSTRPALSEGWKVFGHLNRWTSDHLPLRGSAVRTNADLDQAVFDEVPAYGGGGRPEVISAGGGWLFWAQDVQWACTPTQPVATTLRNATRLARMVRATGARYVLLVPPDKTSVETAELPGRYPGKACSRTAKAAFWSQIASSPPEGYADLYRPLLALRAQLGRPVYKSKDTHWAPLAAGVYARSVVDAVEPGLWDAGAFVPTGRRSELGDLTRFTGVPADNTYDDWAVRRPGVTAYPQVPYTPGKVGSLGVALLKATSAAGARVYPQLTLTIADSFNGVSQSLVTPYLADITSVSVNSAPRDPRDVARMILSSRAVVVESVERAFATGRAPLFSSAFLDSLQRELDAQRRGHS